MRTALSLCCLGLLASPAWAQDRVGPADGGYIVPTSQLVRAAGDSVEFSGRPVDLVLSPDGSTVYAKDNRGLVVIDAENWTLLQQLPFEGPGGSMTGIAVTPDGKSVLAGDAGSALIVTDRAADGRLTIARRIPLPGRDGRDSSYPCGLAVIGSRAFVCLSLSNTLAEVDLAAGAIVREIDVGVAPYGVVLGKDGRHAYVSCWGGRRAEENEKTAPSGGTAALVDDRGVASSGGVTVIDLEAGEPTGFVETGLSACGLALSADGSRLYVANANSDTVSIVDTAAHRVVGSIVAKPDEALPFGSMPNGIALEGDCLFITLAGNNACAVVRLHRDAGEIEGFIPTGWYPGGIAARGGKLYIANVKGVGSRTRSPGDKGFNSHRHSGTIQRVSVPGPKDLAALSERVKADSGVPRVLRALERGAAGVPPRPVPDRAGDPSPIEHVVYIIKENRTYDQVFGDIGRGNSDPSLCIYGREVTPNQHALADQYVLLDNYYCGGVLSADGHSWATEGNVTPYLERSFGGFARSYTFGDDPLTYSSSGFIWDHVLAAGLSFRNYGEFDYGSVQPPASYTELLAAWREGGGDHQFPMNIGVEKLRRYSCRGYPGWNMGIPDVVRAAVFLKELAQFEARGEFPNLVMIYLPNDHTSGTGEGSPTPRSFVADNDLALGQIVEALTRSRFWPKMCVFANEDDPQDGFDHVDGHRSTCLVVSPYSRRGGEVVSAFCNQASVVHTIERILGVPAVNQLYALAPLMGPCFIDRPDTTPFTCLPSAVPLGEMNPAKSSLGPRARELAEQSERLALDKPDRADEDTLNRILWHDARGIDAEYPSHLAGAHGKGLAALGLRLAAEGEIEEEEEENEDDGDHDDD